MATFIKKSNSYWFRLSEVIGTRSFLCPLCRGQHSWKTNSDRRLSIACLCIGLSEYNNGFSRKVSRMAQVIKIVSLVWVNFYVKRVKHDAKNVRQIQLTIIIINPMRAPSDSLVIHSKCSSCTAYRW